MTSDHSETAAKVALVHDSFFIKGGAERMNVEIGKILDADIFASVFKPESYDLRKMGFTGKMVEVFPGFRRGMLGFIRMKFAFLTGCREVSKYPVVFFSNEAIAARVWAGKSKKIYYAHSISRHLFDQKSDYVKKVPRYFRPLFSMALVALRWWYVNDLRAMDLILANSQKNADFLKTLASKVRVEVLYPPVNTGEFFPLPPETSTKSEPYFLSYARLAHAKRIDAIIRAFLLLPDQHLKIVYGKNDPQFEEFRNLANGAANIEFVTLADNSELPNIVRNAIACICVSKNEDFGMVTTESFASGVPVIAVKEGGFLETMVDGQTGIMLESDHSDQDLAFAVKKIRNEPVGKYRNACLERAQLFSLETFGARLRGLVGEV
jgi:glycosyltransferase involved in cell wall biosynthesis